MIDIRAYQLSINSPSIITKLAWDNCAITLRSAGDMGPSGFDPQAMARREALLKEQTLFPQLNSTSAQTKLLGTRQVHGLRVLLLSQPGIARVFEGRWDLNQNKETSLEIIEHAAIAYNGSTAGFCASYQADGIIVKEDFAAAYSLSVTVADCMPLFIKAEEELGTKWRALLHSGWQSTGILAVALEALARASASKLKLEIMAGPAISAQDYAVPLERSLLFAQRFGNNCVVSLEDGQRGISLLEANLALAKGQATCQAKAYSQELDILSFIYTKESTANNDYLHSFRRDGSTGYGRMLAIFAGHSQEKSV